jgi:hypothetical protein
MHTKEGRTKEEECMETLIFALLAYRFMYSRLRSLALAIRSRSRWCDRE